MTPLGGNTHYVAGADFALCTGLLITVLDFNICRKKEPAGEAAPAQTQPILKQKGAGL